MKAITSLFVVLAFGIAKADVQLQVVDEIDNGAILDRTLTLGADASSYTRLKQIAEEFVRRNRPRRRICRLIIGDIAETTALAMGHGTIHGTNYEATISEIERLRLPRGPVARVIAIEGRALLTYRNGDDFREEILMGTADPTIMNFGDSQFRLLHFRLIKYGASVTEKSTFGLRVFLEANPVSMKGTVAFGTWLAGLIKGTLVNVTVRPDPWFIDDPEYPAVLPFVVAGRPPRAAKFKSAPVLACGWDGRSITCSGTTFSP